MLSMALSEKLRNTGETGPPPVTKQAAAHALGRSRARGGRLEGVWSRGPRPVLASRYLLTYSHKKVSVYKGGVSFTVSIPLSIPYCSTVTHP